MTHPLPNQPGSEQQRSELECITRKTHSFDQRMMHIMHIWYPDRSEESLRLTVNGFYELEQFFPWRDGEPCPLMENTLVGHLITYRSI